MTAAKRGSTEARTKEVRENVEGLRALVLRASTEAEWQDVAKRAGAIQRRARLLGGLGRGG